MSHTLSTLRTGEADRFCFSACATSITRQAYSVITYTHSDKTYYSWIEGQLVLPELASGVIVACVPVFPRFLGSFQETWVFSRLSSTLRSLLHRSSRSGSKRSAGGASLPHHVTLKPLTGNGIGWPKTYEELRDEQRGQGTSDLEEEAPSCCGSLMKMQESCVLSISIRLLSRTLRRLWEVVIRTMSGRARRLMILVSVCKRLALFCSLIE